MKLAKILASVLCAVLLCACGGESFQLSELETEDSAASEAAEAKIVLSGDTAEIDGEGASFKDGVLKIDRGGVYNISGQLSGSVLVSATKADKVELVLHGVSISSRDSAAVYVQCVDKVIVTLAKGSENTLSDGEDYAKADGSEPSACLYSADDITVRGEGKLIVEANCRNGIQTKNDLRIKGGEITVTAAKNALKGKDNVEISGGIIKVLSSVDAIKSDNETEEGRGNVTISGGELSLVCQDDGIQAFRSVKISGCKIEIRSGDEMVNCDGEVAIDDGCVSEMEIETEE